MYKEDGFIWMVYSLEVATFNICCLLKLRDLEGIDFLTASHKENQVFRMLLMKINFLFYFSISTEFLTLMRKVVKSPLVMDVLNVQGVQRSLERLADLLGKIQKALGEYLERERASFPRFYFVGDEDLLEIIGNSKNVSRLQKHFKKMFAGVHTITLSEDGALITGISSKEGEQVHSQ